MKSHLKPAYLAGFLVAVKIEIRAIYLPAMQYYRNVFEALLAYFFNKDDEAGITFLTDDKTINSVYFFVYCKCVND